jgi:hypothetical protein
VAEVIKRKPGRPRKNVETTPGIDPAIALEIMRLKAENEALKEKATAKAAPKPLTCKVSAKGGVSVYGLHRFPVTLYMEQWARIFEAQGTIAAFIEAHIGELTMKEED